jgi:hypothetical protein
MTMVASAPFAIAKAIEGLGRGVMDAELNDRKSNSSKIVIHRKPYKYSQYYTLKKLNCFF